MFKSTGRLIYDPYARIKQEKWWAILKTDEEIIRYYQKQLKELFDLRFEKTVWGSHISVIRGEEPKNKDKWAKHTKSQIPFNYSNRIYRKHYFFCVDVTSVELEDIRVELGLPKLPKTGFHLTIGRIDKKYMQEVDNYRNPKK